MKSFFLLAAITLSFSANASDFSCNGTEPFWGLKILGEQMSIDIFGGELKTEGISYRIGAANTGDDFAFVVETPTSTATLIRSECNDGMSDEIYSHHVVYKSGSQVLYGCCNKL